MKSKRQKPSLIPTEPVHAKNQRRQKPTEPPNLAKSKRAATDWRNWLATAPTSHAPEFVSIDLTVTLTLMDWLDVIQAASLRQESIADTLSAALDLCEVFNGEGDERDVVELAKPPLQFHELGEVGTQVRELCKAEGLDMTAVIVDAVRTLVESAKKDEQFRQSLREDCKAT